MNAKSLFLSKIVNERLRTRKTDEITYMYNHHHSRIGFFLYLEDIPRHTNNQCPQPSDILEFISYCVVCILWICLGHLVEQCQSHHAAAHTHK